MHEDCRRRPLALLEESLELLASIIYWRDSSVEGGTWLWQAISFLVGFLAIRFQWYQLQSEDSSRSFIPVEGFSILASQLFSGADLAVYMWGAPSWSASGSLSLYIFSSGVAIVSGSILYCVYCNPYLLYLIYIHLDLNWFSPGGVCPGSCWPKIQCLQMHVISS